MGKCVFNNKWRFTYKWVQEKDVRHKARCVWCKKDIDLGKMGEQALKSHQKSDKHQINMRSMSVVPGAGSIASHFTIKNPPTTSTVTSVSCLNTPNTLSNISVTRPNPVKLGDFISSDVILRSEIYWCLQTIVTHASYKSNEHVSELFQLMFPDSKIASKFQCGERKSSYLAVFGIAEHIRSMVLKEIKSYFIILFDESLNKKFHQKQMDFIIKYWNPNVNRVETRYLGSVFMGHGTALDMVQHFKRGISDLMPKIKSLLQISMDGPNVNWRFFELIKSEFKRDHNVILMNIGSCGLHILHNSFKKGDQASGWDTSSVLSSLYYLFKDSPARREDFRTLTGSDLLPLKFVNHRWMENLPVCERAIQIWDQIVEHVKKVEQKMVPKPTCKSYEVVAKSTKDPLIVIRAKLEFFRYIAKELQPFLGNYQTNRPMIPFLYRDLFLIISNLMKKIIKPDVISESGSKLLSMKLDDKDIFLVYSKIDIGFSAEKIIKDKEKNVVNRPALEFRMECRAFILALIKKLLEKSPVIYSLVKNVSCLDPREMARDPEQCRVRFKKVLTYLVSADKIKEEDCDEIINQYRDLLDNIPIIGSDKFKDFNPYRDSDRADEFLTNAIASHGKESSGLHDVVKMILLLSHGQAAVERGFSVNQKVEVENLQEHSIVAQRLICDYVTSVGGVSKVPITNELLISAKHARQKYEHYLDTKREERRTDEQIRKRKSQEDIINEIQKEAKQAKRDADILHKTCEEYAIKAEKHRNLSFISTSNTLREKAKEKMLRVGVLEKKIEEKQEELKLMK